VKAFEGRQVRRLLAPRPTTVEWVILALLVCAATWFGAGHALLGRIDRTLYDAGLALWRRPPPADIAIVAVDEASIAALGRWPWRRAIHATMVEKLSAAGAKAIALDVILSERDRGDPAGDAALVRATAASGRVVLASPVTEVAGLGARDILPFDELRQAAAAIAHIQVEDDEDGVVRALDLVDGAQDPRPYLGLAALQVAGRAPTPLPGWPAEEGRGRARSHRYLIPYFGADGTVRRYSYLAVLRGDVSPSEFAGKVVFVGSTAAGLGDEHPSPAGGRAAQMAGVEIAAQIAGALQEGTEIRAAMPVQTAILSSTIVLLLYGLYRMQPPRTSLAVTAAAFVGVLAGSFVAFRVAQIWVPPSAALFGIALCYPLWSWRRLEAALRYMRGELESLRGEAAALPALGGKTLQAHRLSDPVDATIAPLQAAIANLRDARRFIADTMESLPQALLVTDTTGRVVLANSRAREWIGFETARARLDAGFATSEGMEGRTIESALLDFRPAASRTWESIIDESLVEGRVAQIEARGPGGRDVLVLFSPYFRANGEKTGLIVNMVDVSEKREAERRREDLLRILSHDMRSPQASIITLLEMRAMDPSAMDSDTILKRVGSLARRTLNLADDFLRLARAEQARVEQFAELDLADVVSEACEEAWTLAHAKRIRIERAFDLEEAPVHGDRSLLLRMIQNLLTNAIKFSPEGTTVTVSLDVQGVSWLLRVADQGRGIAKEDMPRLFTRFGRLGGAEDPGGVGLGLVMVRTVVERHRGVVSVASEPGRGSVFSVSLPALRRPRRA
jgi:signal transduction histidine kinase/CHASE2 domain-containing sensor protein